MEAFHAESLARMMKNEKHFDGDSEDEEEKKREMEAMVMEYERHVEKDEREMSCLLYTSPSPRDRG